jgi:hypothetical protein
MKMVTKKTVMNTAPQAPGEREVPRQILLDDALKGVPFGDETLLAFYIKDVAVDRDFYMSKGRVIPRLLLTVKERVTVEIYGSHMETNADLGLTHMIHNPMNIRIKHIPEFGLAWPSWVHYVGDLSKGWVVATDSRSHLKGDSEKTVFQGVADDPDLQSVLGAIQEIKQTKEMFIPTIHFPGGIREQVQVGKRLLDFLVPVIRNSDYKKLKLIEKCMKYLEVPTRTKLSRYTDSLRAACLDFGRLPTPPELYSKIISEGYELRESGFYKDLNDLGLGWLTRKKSSKTLLGSKTK